MTTVHTYDAVVVGRRRGGPARRHRGLGAGQDLRDLQAVPDPVAHRAAQGGMCAALGNVEEDYPEWHAFDTVKGGDYLVDQPAAILMTEEAVDAVIELEHWGFPFNRTARGQDRPAAVRRPHPQPRRGPVKRACFAADRTGHMILQTLYQQLRQARRPVLQRVLRAGPPAAPRTVERRAWSPTSWPPASSTCSGRRPSCSPPAATGGCSRSPPTPTRSPATGWRCATAAGIPLEDMEILPVPPDRHLQDGHPAVRGGPGRGRDHPERRGRAVHGAVRPHREGPRPPGHGLAARSTRRSRRAAASTARTTCTSTSATSPARSSRRSSPT